MLIAAVEPVLTFAALLGACVWVGGFVTVVVVVRVARRQLDSRSQVAFFRAFGRSYLPVGLASLALALGAGGALLGRARWTALALSAVLVAVALVLGLAAGVAQARAMTRLRQRLLDAPGDDAIAARVRRGALSAAVLRAAIGVMSVGLLALASVLASSRS